MLTEKLVITTAHVLWIVRPSPRIILLKSTTSRSAHVEPIGAFIVYLALLCSETGF